jgi:hypothetical protein
VLWHCTTSREKAPFLLLVEVLNEVPTADKDAQNSWLQEESKQQASVACSIHADSAAHSLDMLRLRSSVEAGPGGNGILGHVIHWHRG